MRLSKVSNKSSNWFLHVKEFDCQWKPSNKVACSIKASNRRDSQQSTLFGHIKRAF